MRVWDISPKYLCNKHLVAEHHELHAIWAIITKNKKGYSQHPETKRWVGKLKALYLRHEKLVKEFASRGYRHLSPLDKKLARGSARQNVLVDSLERQREILKKKNCQCFK
ncbi:MAG: pyrimidine dimer DNA glycosylase/endonuclease V [Patescibacteria group bacterium]|jgi:hypothetical protein